MGKDAIKPSSISSYQLNISEQVAIDLKLPKTHVSVCIDLLDSGASIPFIARYRKEATGALNDEVIFNISTHLVRIRKLEERRKIILTKINESGKLTDKLEESILHAKNLAELEDIYLPYKSRRKTRADKAREGGLEPLAELLLIQDSSICPIVQATRYINPEYGIFSAQEALLGAEDIIAGQVAEDSNARNIVRQIFHQSAKIHVTSARGTGGDAGKYREYVGSSESVHTVPSHRILAMFRGEDEGLLSVKIEPCIPEAIELLVHEYVSGESPAAKCISDAVIDGYHRLIAPSLEREMRNELKSRADEEAACVFATNLRSVLRSPPLGPARILAIDPGFRTGCKVVVLNEVGDPIDTDTIFPHEPRPDPVGAGKIVQELCEKYQISVIAIGDGTAGRETWQFVRMLKLSAEISIVSVPEQGASVYSASKIGREELPDLDVTMRGAVSIGRRLLDPLAEMVKIEPHSLGVGQYQHDIDESMLKEYLIEVVRAVVNEVGVDVNSASIPLLSYVSGLNSRIAAAIVQYREKNGLFLSREELKLVKGIGEKIYEQAVGFLRIQNGRNPLDNTGVHPERYQLVADMAHSIGSQVHNLIGNEELVRQINPDNFVTGDCGIPTLTDIFEDLIRPGRDPRGVFEPPVYADQVSSFDDLQEGMILNGVITNVTKFGAFVNLGISENGLIHISELADRFICDPAEIVSMYQRVRIRVIGIDSKNRRISLSLKQVGIDA